MKYRYVYEIVNTINGHTYVGQRSSNCPPSEDDYWGSGFLIKKAIAKHGLEAFQKRILAEGMPSRQELSACEKFWIAKRKTEGHAEYNIAPGGSGGDTLRDMPEKRVEARRKGKVTRDAWTPERRAAHAEKLRRRNKKRWAEMSPEEYARVCETQRQATKRSYENPEFYKRKCAINAKNAAIQSATQRSAEWIESTGRVSHSIQNIHLAKGFYKDRDGKLYTRSAVLKVLKCPVSVTWAFGINWELSLIHI